MPLDNTSLILQGFQSLGQLGPEIQKRQESVQIAEAPASDIEKWVAEQLARGMTPAEASAAFRLGASGTPGFELPPGLMPPGGPQGAPAPQAQGLGAPGVSEPVQPAAPPTAGAPGPQALQGFQAPQGLSAPAPMTQARGAPPSAPPGIKTRGEYGQVLKGAEAYSKLQPRRRSTEEEAYLSQVRGSERMKGITAQQTGANERAGLRALVALSGQDVTREGIGSKEKMFGQSVSNIDNALKLVQARYSEALKLMQSKATADQGIEKMRLLADVVGRLDSNIAAVVNSDAFVYDTDPRVKDIFEQRRGQVESVRDALKQAMEQQGLVQPETGSIQSILNFLSSGTGDVMPIGGAAESPPTPDIPTSVPVREPAGVPPARAPKAKAKGSSTSEAKARAKALLGIK